MEDDIAEAIGVFGGDWQPNGVRANAKVIETLCKEQYEQGLVTRQVEPAEVFAEFERAANSVKRLPCGATDEAATDSPRVPGCGCRRGRDTRSFALCVRVGPRHRAAFGRAGCRRADGMAAVARSLDGHQRQRREPVPSRPRGTRPLRLRPRPERRDPGAAALRAMGKPRAQTAGGSSFGQASRFRTERRSPPKSPGSAWRPSRATRGWRHR